LAPRVLFHRAHQLNGFLLVARFNSKVDDEDQHDEFAFRHLGFRTPFAPPVFWNQPLAFWSSPSALVRGEPDAAPVSPPSVVRQTRPRRWFRCDRDPLRPCRFALRSPFPETLNTDE